MDKAKLRNQIVKFEEHLIVDLGLSGETAHGYCRSLSIALRRMKTVCPTRQHIRNFIVWMHDKNFSYSHIANTSRALEHYARFKGMNVRLGRPRKPKRVIQNVLSEPEIYRLIKVAKNVREKAIVCLLAYSGLRAGELRKIRVADLRSESNQIRIPGSGNKRERIVHISAVCTRVLIDYLKHHPRTPVEFLFTTLAKDNQLAAWDIRKLIRVLAARARFDKRVFPDLLRHSLATNLLKRGASLIAVKDQLGHAFLETTTVYAASMPDASPSEYEVFKPAYL